MSDNYSLAVGCIVRKGDEVLLYSDEEYKKVRANDFTLYI